MAVFLRPRLPEKVRQAASGTRDVSRDGSIFEWRAAATTDTRSSRKRKHDDDDDDDDLGQPHDTPPIPVHLAKVVKADYWDEIAQTRTIDHGYLDPDFTDKRLMAYYRNSAGPNANLEVVKYSRLDPTENGHGQGTGKAAPSFLGSKEQAVAAGYRTSILYSRCDGRKQVELRLDRTVASGTIDHERERMKRRISAALHQLEQLKQKGGLMTIISHRIERISSHREKVLLALSLSPPLSLPLHRRFDWPRAPPPDVVGDYEKAFSSWDQAMAKSIPSYAANITSASASASASAIASANAGASVSVSANIGFV
ncbi:hypothetical protein ABEF92_005651 [Exophiala dermatitidis]|uniref:Uncharacterized protein n=1 Tax=Exophiala dermatitidis (strain ATCC 34100 / CBS 525.76 / NIH/UT8656) TaxID=858893 RepID=H6BPS5_EXODN|nr:uncharacterized protein HMPREF1120_01862 [Exophiala dermatitidis NIH/UT8656]EHY53677.1 hypothetical protein HMPREF1120_01862 [Exophiala dermatitidis NIH/UT8656]